MDNVALLGRGSRLDVRAFRKHQVPRLHLVPTLVPVRPGFREQGSGNHLLTPGRRGAWTAPGGGGCEGAVCTALPLSPALGGSALSEVFWGEDPGNDQAWNLAPEGAWFQA